MGRQFENMVRRDFDGERDSLDRLDRMLAIEAALIRRIKNDYSLSSDQRAELIREVEARAQSGDFPEGDDWDDDDTLARFVRRSGPKGPPGGLRASVSPESGLEVDSDIISSKSPRREPNEHSAM